MITVPKHTIQISAIFKFSNIPPFLHFGHPCKKHLNEQHSTRRAAFISSMHPTDVFTYKYLIYEFDSDDDELLFNLPTGFPRINLTPFFRMDQTVQKFDPLNNF